MNIDKIIKFFIDSSPVTIMGLFYASIIYFGLPEEYKKIIGLLDQGYSLSKIFGLLLLLSVGFMLGYLTKYLGIKLKRIPSTMKNRAEIQKLKSKSALSILKQINDEGNKILRSPGVPGIPSAVSPPEYLAKQLEIPLTEVLHYFDLFKDMGFLEYDDWEGIVFGLSSRGRAFLVKNMSGKIT